jgi:hypothetical protein
MKQSLADQLAPAQVIEAAIVAFGDELGIEDPDDIAASVSALTRGAVDEATADAMIAAAAEKAENDVVHVLRMLMASAQEGESGPAVRQALTQAGAKQMALTPDLMYIGSALIAMLAVFVPIKKETRRSIKIEENPDGRKKVTIDENTIYLNPKSLLVSLIQKMVGAAGGAGAAGDAG